MNNEKFLALETVSDIMQDKFQALYDKGEFQEIEKKIQNILLTISENFSVELNLSLSVFDSERDNSIQMCKTGITGSGSDSHTYIHNERYKFNRYLSKGNIVEIPHNYCPNCWGEWDFKKLGSSCSTCSVTFGKEVKLLLDSNDCPHCNIGKISQTEPQCTNCDFEANDEIVIWG